MRKTVTVASLVLAGVLAGCEEKKATPQPPAPPQPAPQAQKSVVDQAKDAAGQAKVQVTQAVDQAKTQVQQATTQVTTEVSKAVDQAKVTGQQTIDQTKVAAASAQQSLNTQISQFTSVPATAPTTAPSTATTFDYKAKLDETMTYIKSHKLELADKTLAQVEARRASIPVEYHSKIDGLRKMINTAKTTQNATQGLSLPKF